jgi:(p)ppGpp synthase/HD superfamily hydrolase
MDDNSEWEYDGGPLVFDTDDIITNAINYAVAKHSGQVRKGTNTPYITHPFEVMEILKEEGCTETVRAAGMLHDVLEDTNATKEEILKYFGEEVLKLVSSETEDKSKTWQERKQTTINELDNADNDVKMICFADKLANLRSMAADLEKVGEKLWERFNADKLNIEWYYTSIYSKMNNIINTKMYEEYSVLLKKVFGEKV